MYSRSAAAAFALLASSVTWRAHADAPLPDAEADAVLLARSGDRARIAGRFSEAEASYRASLALAPDPATELSLALALAAQGKALLAAPLLARLQRSLPDEEEGASGDRSRATSGNRSRATSGNRSRAARALADVQRELATFTVETGVAGAVVEVDGAPVGLSPLPDPVFVAPGSHTVRAWKDRHQAAGATFDAAAGSTYAVQVTVTASARRDSPDSPSPAGAPHAVVLDGAASGPKPRRAGHAQPGLSRLDSFFVGPAGGGRAVGIALTVTGLVAGLSSLAAAGVSDASAHAADARLRQQGGGPCGPAALEKRADCAAVRSAIASRSTASIAAGVLLTGAGVVGVTTFFSVFLLPPTGPIGQAGGPSSTLSPIAGPTGGGVSLEALW